jgi:predicted RNA-binding protein (virulence factor B family)
MPYNYKSDAQLIKDVFGLSKKEFKRTLTSLQEKNKIEVKDTGIYLKD